PFAQTPFLWTYVMVRTQGPPLALAGAIRAAVSSVDPGLEAAAIKPMTDVMAETVAQPRFNVLLLSALAGLALVLAAVGIYGVISCSVAQRPREIGIRMALGADRRDVILLVTGGSLRLAGMGVAAGRVGAGRPALARPCLRARLDPGRAGIDGRQPAPGRGPARPAGHDVPREAQAIRPPPQAFRGGGRGGRVGRGPALGAATTPRRGGRD